MKYQLVIAIAIATSIGLQMSSIAESRFRSIESQFTHHLLLSRQPNLVDFPEVGLAIPQPSGFTKATSFYGFEQDDTKSSVMLSKIPGPFAEVTTAFDKNTLATRGIDLISKRSVKIDNQPGLLLNISQSAYGLKFIKWVLVFGNAQNTNVITATFPSTNAAKLSEPLKKIILAVEPSTVAAPVASSLPFTIATVEGLVPVKKAIAAGKAAAFTRDGNIPLATPTDPLFIVAPSLGKVPVGDTKAFASKRLLGYSQFEIGTITSTKEISIDNLPGWEIVADALDRQTQAPLKVYQVMLFPQSGGYIVAIGTIGYKQADLYLPKFKASALTYRNLPK